MYPPGHFAINLILVSSSNSIIKSQPNIYTIPFWPALVAAILPDITDKVATDYLQWMPYGRNYLHNLTAAFAGGLLLGWIFRRWEIGVSWTIGLIGHLIGDFVYIPWLWPWFDYLWPNETRQIAQGVVQTVFDLAQGKSLSPIAAAIWQYGRLIMESIMFGAVLIYLSNRFQFRERVLALILALTAWFCIVFQWDWAAFVWSFEHFGIK